MSYSVKRGSLSWRVRFRTIQRFLYEKVHKVRLKAYELYSGYDITGKIAHSFTVVFNVAFTGLIIDYAIHNNNFISYGLMAALAVYYTQWLIETIKRPHQ